MRRIFLAIGAAVACIGALYVVMDTKPAPLRADTMTETLTIVTAGGPQKFQIEVARTDEQQRLGLMFRTKLARNAGMLFVYDPPQEITMWMRNTHIPLDMVFIKADGRVLRVAADAEPFSLAVIASKGQAAAVLEINAGLGKALGIAPGNRVQHAAFGTAK